MLYASECLSLKTTDVHRLQRYERATIIMLCGVKMATTSPRLNISDLGAAIFKSKRPRLFDHIKRGDTWTAKASALVIDGQTPRGRSRDT